MTATLPTSQPELPGLPGTPGVDRRHRPSDFYHERTNFKFMAHLNVYKILFALVVVGGLVLVAVRPLNFGIDFNGGVSWQVTVRSGQNAKAAEIRDLAAKAGLTDFKATIATTGGRQTIRVQAQVVNDPLDDIRDAIAKATGKSSGDVSDTQTGKAVTFTVTKVAKADQKAIEAALAKLDLGGAKATVTVSGNQVNVALDKTPTGVRDTLTNSLAKYAGVSADAVSISSVGPTWGDQVSQKALVALVVFFFVLAVYLSIRFEFKMAVAAIIAVLHDIIFTIAVYSITQFNVSPATVTAFLTILGFSLYDTVVVFDKIRENQEPLLTVGRTTYTEMVDRSLNQVLMRSLSTSFVALLPVLSLLVVGVGIFGATALEDFALALFAGLFVGSYSSIFVATPLLAMMKEREPQYRALRERREARAAAAARSAASTPSVASSAAGDDAAPNSDWDTTGVAGPPAVGRYDGGAPRGRQQRRRKRT
jgi:preprotein translocase subunit SecF